MSFSLFIALLAGMLQLAVVAYALRLNRLFGTARVGWSLFTAFLLMALLHLVQSIAPLTAESGTRIDALYALASLLLFTGMIYVEAQLENRKRLELKERQIRTELEADVKKKTVYLLRALEGLQAEMDERKRMEAAIGSVSPFNPGLFDSFSDLLTNIPDHAIMRTLKRESYMLSLDLAEQRSLPAVDAGSILVFARFIESHQQENRDLAPAALPPTHVTFYRQILQRLIISHELLPEAMDQFEKLFGSKKNADFIPPMPALDLEPGPAQVASAPLPLCKRGNYTVGFAANWKR